MKKKKNKKGKVSIKRKAKSSVTIGLPINSIICDNCVRVMRKFPDNSIDSIVTDPPYGLEFMGKDWDKLGASIEPTSTSAGGALAYSSARVRYGKSVKSMQQWHYKWAKECLRVAKPGAFMFVFGGTRTFHRLACAVEDAGWQIRDCMMWFYGSGFPKSKDIGKEFDRQACRKQLKKKLGRKPTKKEFEKAWKKFRKVIGQKGGRYKDDFKNNKGKFVDARDVELPDRINLGEITVPISKLAQLWDGYGTAFKPSWESIIVAMKPVDSNFAKNAEKYGVAGLNIDGGRISIDLQADDSQLRIMNRNKKTQKDGWGMNQKSEDKPQVVQSKGRWPANVLFDEVTANILDNQVGEKVSRFFYVAKASREERNAGLGNMKAQHASKVTGRKIDAPGAKHSRSGMAQTPQQNIHPTVKPIQLMKYLCMLLKMPNKNQIILDPFVGSGTTCTACKELGINYIGIDKEKEYCEIARQRLKNVKRILFEKPKKKLNRKTKESFGLI